MANSRVILFAPVGLVDQGLEGHLLLEAVVVLQALQGGQLGQTLQTRRGRVSSSALCREIRMKMLATTLGCFLTAS